MIRVSAVSPRRRAWPFQLCSRKSCSDVGWGHCTLIRRYLLADGESPYAALQRWISLFFDFVITKQGLVAVLQSDDPCYDPLHSYFLDRLEPVCAHLLRVAAESGAIHNGQDAYELMRGVGSICAGAGHPRYDPRHLTDVLIAGLSLGHPRS